VRLAARPRERVVVPRQERGIEQPSGLDIELREVRKGLKPGDRFLRVVPKQRLFRQDRTGHIEATLLASKPRGPMERFVASVKNAVLGSPFATSRLIHERLSKIQALAIFSSDALSSSAYATEEILIILLLAGSGALHYSLPISLLIVLLLVIVTASYVQTIKAYPGGGGAFIVANDNLGRSAGLVAGAALLVDYTLTVSVSVAAGVAAVTSALPELQDVRVPIGVVVIFLITVGNLRGIKEAGTVFAIPTYFFIVSMASVIAIGFVKVAIGDAPGSLTEAAPPQETVAATTGITLFLLMKAFSSGSAALTGIEAISNGVPAFKTPQVRNAQMTMVYMAGILALLFLGITFLSSRYGLVPNEDETIVSQLGKDVLGQNISYYSYQVGTALVLFLAANTSFNGFPPLGAILARERFLPRQFAFRGDRLAYSNGIMILAAAAAIVLAVFGGEVTRLIPLYALGVFVSFTLSQAGMVRRWARLRGAGWQVSLAINSVGAVATAIVAVVVGATKLTGGAWMSVVMMMALILTFTLIRRHYDWFTERTKVDEDTLPIGVPTAVSLVSAGDPTRYMPPRDHVIVPVDGVNKISLGAIGMAREMSRMVTAVHLTDDPEHAEAFRDEWSHAVPDVPLLVIESPFRAFVAPMLAFVESLEKTEPQRIIVILPSFVVHHWWERFLHNRDVLRLRPLLKERESIRVVDFPWDEKKAPPDQPPAGATA
jgi:amino acid transporter